MGNTQTTLPTNADHEEDQSHGENGGLNKKRQYDNESYQDASSPSNKKQKTLADDQTGVLIPARVICFTGFKKHANNMYSSAAQKDLMSKLSAAQLSPAAQVLDVKLNNGNRKTIEAELSRVSHVIAPPLARTPTVLLATLSGKWILPPEYLLACLKQGRWLEESNYGFRLKIDSNTGNTSVFLKPNSTKAYIASSFDKTYDSNASQQCKLLLQYAHINVVPTVQAADLILVGGRDKCSSAEKQECIESQPLQKIYTLERFMEMIYPQYYASSVKHAAEKFNKSQQ